MLTLAEHGNHMYYNFAAHDAWLREYMSEWWAFFRQTGNTRETWGHEHCGHQMCNDQGRWWPQEESGDTSTFASELIENFITLFFSLFLSLSVLMPPPLYGLSASVWSILQFLSFSLLFPFVSTGLLLYLLLNQLEKMKVLCTSRICRFGAH